jgi:hypothetical protein
MHKNPWVSLFAFLLCFAAPGLAQHTEQPSPRRIVGRQTIYQATGEDTFWIWGIDGRTPFLLDSSDAGVRWQACPLPPAAARDIEARLSLPGSAPGFEVQVASRNELSIDWRTSNNDGYVTGIGSARTGDGCQHWEVVEGKVIPPPGLSFADLQIQPDNFRVQWLALDGIVPDLYGWALLTGNCCGSGQQPTAMVRTKDGGRTWNVIQRDAQRGVPDMVREGFEMRSLEDGWFASANWGDVRPGLRRLSSGGELWADVSEALPVVAELKDNASVTGATAPVFSKTRPQEGFFAGQFEYLVDGGNSASGHAEVRYETNDNGTTWRIAQVNLHADRAPDAASRP